LKRAAKALGLWVNEKIVLPEGDEAAEMLSDIALFEPNQRGRRAFDVFLDGDATRLDASDFELARRMGNAFFSLFHCTSSREGGGVELEYPILKRLTLLSISQNGLDLIQRRRGEFDMAAPISLRVDFDGPMLRALALSEKAGSVTRRLLSLVTIYEGGMRADAARLGGVGLQTLRDWVLRFNAKGPDGLVDGKSTGRPPLLDDKQRRALVAMVEAGPIPAIHEVVRWRLIDLVQWVFDEYGLSVTKQILSRELRALGYRKLSARPRHHEHDEATVAAFKKKSQTSSLISRRPPESRLSCGSKTKPASVRKTRSRGAGPNAARDPSP
jgi:transposase